MFNPKRTRCWALPQNTQESCSGGRKGEAVSQVSCGMTGSGEMAETNCVMSHRCVRAARRLVLSSSVSCSHFFAGKENSFYCLNRK